MMRTGNQFKGVRTADLSTPTSTPRFITYKPQVTVRTTPTTSLDNLFFRFVSRRYEKASLVITSNKGFAEWTELFEDPIIVAALLDRLLHHSVIVNIRGQSYRLRGKNSSIRKVTAAA